MQVALEVLPNNPQSTHLREVITPVVYFLVLTSIIVHGITIPIGKAGSRSLTLTRSLTFSRSNTINNDGVDTSGITTPGGLSGSGITSEGDQRRGNGLHNISRLPPPILAGLGELPIRELIDNSSSSSGDIQSQAGMEVGGLTSRMKGSRDVRFQDEDKASSSQ